MAVLAYFLTKNPELIYTSKTTLYTGIATGTGVDMEKSLNFLTTNTAFDNLINIIKSRETQQEVAIRLLAQHLLLDQADPKYISSKSYNELKSITPEYINRIVIRDKNVINKGKRAVNNKVVSEDGVSEDNSLIDSTALQNDFSFSSLSENDNSNVIPRNVNPESFYQTIENLKSYLMKNDTNFVYKLLYYNHPHYSINAISRVSVRRIGNSDLVDLSYDSDDQGICQQTLFFMTEVCIENYKSVKENRSDAVVKYFEHQVKQAAGRLKVGEDKLLKFNMDYNIINYYEQSKAVAIVKENLEVSYHEMRIKVAGSLAAIKRIEEKISNQKDIQLNNANIIENRRKLSEINAKIATIETIDFDNLGDTSTKKSSSLVKLKIKADKLKEDLHNSVNKLYNNNNSIDGLQIGSLLNDWLKNVIEYEENRAGLAVLGDRIIEFQKQYSVYAPAGANIKRIEREINVSEQEFLELLHGLNLAKLKMQDAELSASIKAIDPPYFPLAANPTKRKLLVLIAGLFGFLLVFSIIIVLEFFDESLKNQKKAEGILGMSNLGVFPKIFLNTGTLNFPFVANRLLEMIIQNMGILLRKQENANRSFLFFSTLGKEGKTTIISNLAQKLILQGKTVLVLNYSEESLKVIESSQIGYKPKPGSDMQPKKNKRTNNFPLISKILGYSDPRVDFDSPFIQSPIDKLPSGTIHYYDINADYHSAITYKDLLKGYILDNQNPDFVFIEIPNILTYPFPEELVKNANCVMVARANHAWSTSDQNLLKNLINLTGNNPQFILNGLDLSDLESVLGDLPKKRSRFRRIIKRLIRFEFFTGYQP
jgi:hypothetical protein